MFRNVVDFKIIRQMLLKQLIFTMQGFEPPIASAKNNYILF